MGRPPSTNPAPDLSVVVACYMEAEHLVDSVAQLTATLDGLGRSYELVFVEDKSSDRTAAIVAELVAGRPERRAVYHAVNQGRGATVAEGFRLARGRIVGFLDIDLEVHCRFLPSLLAAIDARAPRVTIEWLLSQQCADGSFCNAAGFCQSLADCRDNGDCPSDRFCDVEARTCRPRGQCTADHHCEFGRICDTRTGLCIAGCRQTADLAPPPVTRISRGLTPSCARRRRP
jgi:glycosyltransferase involved in cell wall biosynthesis